MVRNNTKLNTQREILNIIKWSVISGIGFILFIIIGNAVTATSINTPINGSSITNSLLTTNVNLDANVYYYTLNFTGINIFSPYGNSSQNNIISQIGGQNTINTTTWTYTSSIFDANIGPCYVSIGDLYDLAWPYNYAYNGPNIGVIQQTFPVNLNSNITSINVTYNSSQVTPRIGVCFNYTDGTTDNSSEQGTVGNNIEIQLLNPHPEKTVNYFWIRYRASGAAAPTGMNVTKKNVAYGLTNIVNNINLLPLNYTTGYYNITLTAYNSSMNYINTSTTTILYAYNSTLNISFYNYTNSLVPATIQINNTQGYDNRTINTSTGSMLIGVEQGDTYTYFANSTSQYATTNGTYTPTKQNNFLNLTMYPYNSIYFTFLDEQTQLPIINDTLIISMQNTNTYLNYTVTNATTFNLTGLPLGQYTMTVNSIYYSTRTYIITVGSASSQAITIRLLLSGVKNVIDAYIKNNQLQVAPNVLVTIQRQYYGGSFATVTTMLSDMNGHVNFNVQPSTQYQVILYLQGYNINTFYQMFQTSSSPYAWTITNSNSNIYTAINSLILFSYYPHNQQLNRINNQNFSVTAYNLTNNQINWIAVNTNGFIVNVTGSLGGGTASNIIDLTNLSGIYPVVYSVSYYDPNSQSNVVYYLPINYYIIDNTIYNSTQTNMSTVLTNFKNDTGDLVWTTIFAMFLTLAVVVTLMQLGGNPVLGMVGGIAAIGFFSYIGWINLLVGMVSCTLMILILVYTR